METKRRLLIILSAIGTAFMSYLIYLHFAPDAQSFCNIGESFSCEAVNKSIYSNLFGVPVSLGGLLFFIAILYISLGDFTEKTAQHITALTIAMLIPSLYLTGVSKYWILKYCLYCELSKVIMVLIIVLMLSIASVRKNVKYLLLALIAGLLFAGAAYYSHSKLVPSGKYDTFVQCMYDNGVRMYGSITCAHCARQRQLIGDSIQFLNEIECDPRNEGAEVELCLEKDIVGTPTFILEDEEGDEIKRLSPGEKSLEELAEFSGCELIKDN
jgi:uncharacterized membrane protein